MSDTIGNITETKKEVITVRQGRPSSPYFKIIQPVPGIEFTVNQEVHCINPKTNKVTKGIVTKFFWIFDWAEPPRGELITIYGVEPKLLRNVLIGTDVGFNDPWARLITIKETI